MCFDASTAEEPKLTCSEHSGDHLRVASSTSNAAPRCWAASANVASQLQAAVDDAVNCNNDLVRVVFVPRCNQHDRLLMQAADVLIERASLVNCATRLPCRTPHRNYPICFLRQYFYRLDLP
jgi:hypothetical protein